jgi:hypothetical protein
LFVLVYTPRHAASRCDPNHLCSKSQYTRGEAL